MTFTIGDVKSIAAGIKGALPVDKPMTVEISCRFYDPESKEFLNMILQGTPPGLTLEVSLNGKYLKFFGQAT